MGLQRVRYDWATFTLYRIKTDVSLSYSCCGQERLSANDLTLYKLAPKPVSQLWFLALGTMGLQLASSHLHRPSEENSPQVIESRGFPGSPGNWLGLSASTARAQDQYLVGELILQATQHSTGKTKKKVTAYFLTTLAVLEKKWVTGKLWRHHVSSVVNPCTPSNYGGLL